MANPFSKEKYPFCWKGHRYAQNIVDRKIPASIYVIGACERYFRDLEETKDPNGRWTFSKDAAEKYLRTTQKFDHVIGEWETDNIVYEPWQCWVWMCIMGFISRESGYRRFRIVHLEVARGNAKSAMASQAGLYFGFLDNPKGNQVATVATKKEQARIVLDSSMAMARKNPSFLKRTGVRVLAHSIVQDATNSKIRALASEHSGLDGLNDILAIMDELHAMRRETFDVVTSGMSKRKDSLILCITTAGFNVDSVGHSQSVYAKKVALGEVQDEQFFSAVYCIDEKDDIYDESCWIKANPNWGVSVDPVTFRAKVAKTKSSPSDIPNVKVKHLNLWISEANAFFDVAKWDECADTSLNIDAFKGQRSRMGIDLASNIDLTALAQVFYRPAKRNSDGEITEQEKYFIFEKTFVPEGTVKEANNVLYDTAIANGHLIETKGDAINNDFIREEALAWSKDFKVQECYYDTWNATEMAQKLSNKIEMVKFAMNTANFSEPMKKLDSLMREKKLVHNGSPLLRWCLSNIVAKRDANDNVFPKKSHPRLKIDPVIAVLMALAGWLQDQQKETVYETRGIRFIS